jgi:15-cis-phytoene synthase
VRDADLKDANVRDADLTDAAFKDIVETARTGEPERYLAALLAPDDVRSDILAVVGFAAEMRRIPQMVTEPMMGELRLQWWRDQIEGFAADQPTGHALADALAKASRRHQLQPLVLMAMTEARAFDLYDDPMADAAALAGYLTKTEAAPFSLVLQILQVDAPVSLADLAGRAFGLTRLLAALPHALARGRLPLPLDLLQETNTSAEDLLQGRTTPAVTALYTHLIRDIEAAAAAARTAARRLSRPQRTALLPLATIPPYLTAIRRGGTIDLRRPVEVIPVVRNWRIAHAHWLGL